MRSFFVGPIVDNDKSSFCKEPSEAEKSALLAFVNSSPIDEAKLISTINSVCKSAIIAIGYENIKPLFIKLAASKRIREAEEIAILRLASSIGEASYADFYSLLEMDGNAILKNLISKMHDSIYPWDGDNYTGFVGGLVTMFGEHPAAYIDRFDVADHKILGRIIHLDPITFERHSSFYYASFKDLKYEGEYDPSTGQVYINEKYTTITTGTHAGYGALNSTVRMDTLSPLTPVVVRFENSLPLIQTAISGAPPLTGDTYIVPAIFLKYKSDKERNDAIEKGLMITLDVATIFVSGGTALATKIHWARRIWALTEVAGAAGNLMINAEVLPPHSKVREAVELYNVTMGLVGVKNLGKGAIRLARDLPENLRNLLRSNGSIKVLLSGKYSEYKAALTKAKASEEWAKLQDATKDELLKQEKFFDELVDEAGVLATGGGKFASFKNISKLPDNILSKIEAKGWADDVLTKLDADLAGDAFKLKLTNEVEVVDGWGILRNTPYKTNPRYLDYVNSLKSEAKFGTSVRKDYRKTFFEAFPELTESDYVIHHAIEQQVLKNFPGIITEAEMHSLQNLRGIPKTINSDVHLRRIRSEWDDFYLDNPNPTKQQLLQKAKEIDDLLGSQFYPPVR